MASGGEIDDRNLIDLAEARDRRERAERGHSIVDVPNVDIDVAIHVVLSKRLDAVVTKAPVAVEHASLSMVNGVLELMGRDRAVEPELLHEALSTLIILIGAARAAATDLVPEALRRRLQFCDDCLTLNAEEKHDDTPFAFDAVPARDLFCKQCKGMFNSFDAYARQVRHR